MPYGQIVTLAVLCISSALFAFEVLPPDVVALGVCIAFVVSGILTPDQAFAGFGSSTVVTLLGLLLMTQGLKKAGVMYAVVAALIEKTRDRPKVLVFAVLFLTLAVSSFMSNTATTAFFLPVILGLSSKRIIGARETLLPLAFSSMLSSGVTLISTSSNIVASTMFTQLGLEPIGMFELTPIGLPMALVGFAYIWIVGRRQLAEREVPQADDESSPFGVKPYVAEVVVGAEFRFVDRRLEEAHLGDLFGIQVIKFRRNGRAYFPRPDTVLTVGDTLVVTGAKEELLAIKDIQGFDLRPDARLVDPQSDPEGYQVVEAVVLAGSLGVGRTLKQIRLREVYDVIVLGLNRHGASPAGKLSSVFLRAGDVLLLQGSEASIRAVGSSGIFNVIGPIERTDVTDRRKLPAVLCFFLGAIALSAFGIVDTATAVLLGALLMMCSRILTPEEAYRRLDWSVLILVGGLLSVGVALTTSGLAESMATHVAEASRSLPPLAVLSIFFAFTVILSQPLSNQGAAVIMIPIAVKTASLLGLPPRTFGLAVTLAASCSFLTPLEPSCLLVYGAGRYKISDFFKVGAPLTLLCLVVVLILLPILNYL